MLGLSVGGLETGKEHRNCSILDEGVRVSGFRV